MNTGSATANDHELKNPGDCGGPLMAVTAAEPSIAQSGGILKMYLPDSPASMSVLGKSTAISRANDGRVQ